MSRRPSRASVSVLFSEPKIPQFGVRWSPRGLVGCFSALQRAENSSMQHQPAVGDRRTIVSVLFSEPKIPQSEAATAGVRAYREFQCSSASRKFLNLPAVFDRVILRFGFSALQRAENSSIFARRPLLAPKRVFQCSSASRKFLNVIIPGGGEYSIRGFSALQRAENSSIPHRAVALRRTTSVSVLFSEPKIPQSWALREFAGIDLRFSALQRAENSSM